jgi:hypothetical protein
MNVYRGAGDGPQLERARAVLAKHAPQSVAETGDRVGS